MPWASEKSDLNRCVWEVWSGQTVKWLFVLKRKPDMLENIWCVKKKNVSLSAMAVREDWIFQRDQAGSSLLTRWGEHKMVSGLCLSTGNAMRSAWAGDSSGLFIPEPRFNVNLQSFANIRYASCVLLTLSISGSSQERKRLASCEEEREAAFTLNIWRLRFVLKQESWMQYTSALTDRLTSVPPEPKPQRPTSMCS